MTWWIPHRWNFQLFPKPSKPWCIVAMTLWRWAWLRLSEGMAPEIRVLHEETTTCSSKGYKWLYNTLHQSFIHLTWNQVNIQKGRACNSRHCLRNASKAPRSSRMMFSGASRILTCSLNDKENALNSLANREASVWWTVNMGRWRPAKGPWAPHQWCLPKPSNLAVSGWFPAGSPWENAQVRHLLKHNFVHGLTHNSQ